VDKSLVAVSDTGLDRRYRMLETVREYALECLERSGGGEELRSAHAAIYVALCEAAAPQLGLADELAWLHRLDVEFDNVRAAVNWLLERGDMMSVLWMALALAQFAWVRGRVREQRQWWDRCLEHISADSPLRSTAAVLVGVVTFTLGDYDRSLPLLEEGAG